MDDGHASGARSARRGSEEARFLAAIQDQARVRAAEVDPASLRGQAVRFLPQQQPWPARIDLPTPCRRIRPAGTRDHRPRCRGSSPVRRRPARPVRRSRGRAGRTSGWRKRRISMRARVSSTACFQNRVVTTSRSLNRTRRRCSRNRSPAIAARPSRNGSDAKVAEAHTMYLPPSKTSASCGTISSSTSMRRRPAFRLLANSARSAWNCVVDLAVALDQGGRDGDVLGLPRLAVDQPDIPAARRARHRSGGEAGPGAACAAPA